MTRRLVWLIGMMAMWSPIVFAELPTYGKLTYGFERKNWNVICQEYPVQTGERIPDAVATALENEGWLVPGKPYPASYEVNSTCRRLGYPPTRTECETCPKP